MPQVTKGPLLEYGQVDLQLAFPLGFNNKRPHLKKKICSLIFRNWDRTLRFKGIWVVAKTKKWWTGH